MRRFVTFLTVVSLLLALEVAPALADNAISTGADYQNTTSTNLVPSYLHAISERNTESARIIEGIEKHGGLPDEKDIADLKRFSQKWYGNENVRLPKSEKGLRIIYYNVLGVQGAAQETTYYCGPASAYQLLSYLGITSYNCESLTQANLASDLNTTSSGTDWTGTWVTTLNNWSGNARWSTQNSPNSTFVWNTTSSNVVNNWPLVYDTHMSSSRGYLVGYSTYEWYHYVTGDGIQWDDYNLKAIHYVDPNNYRTGTFGPHYIDLTTMTSVLQDRGMVY